MFERLRQSLALRLAVQYALVFALGAALLFGALYWLLADALEKRERAVLERQTLEFGSAFERAGAAGLIARVRNDSSPETSALFVRLINPTGTSVFDKWPSNWIETEIKRVPIGAYEVTQQIQTVRVPQNALRDYTIASQQWANGWVLQVGRLMDSRAVLLEPLRRAFVGI